MDNASRKTIPLTKLYSGVSVGNEPKMLFAALILDESCRLKFCVDTVLCASNCHRFAAGKRINK